MVQLLFQTLGVAAAAALGRALLARAGLRVQYPQAAALVILLFLAVHAVNGMRDSWKALDVQREANAAQTEESSRAGCTAAGVDIHFLEFVGSKIPTRERYFMEFGQGTIGGEICARMLLLPRLQVWDIARARYVVFFGSVPKDRLAEVKRLGAKIHRWDGAHLVAELP